jgi:hypothetical protein
MSVLYPTASRDHSKISPEHNPLPLRSPYMASDVARVRHRAVIASYLRHWYSAQLAKCSEDAETMLQRAEQMELPIELPGLQYSFPLARYRARRH